MIKPREGGFSLFLFLFNSKSKIMKELPFFKFYPDQWMIGDITLEGYDAQGVFINLCSYYWKRGANAIALRKLKQRFANVSDDTWQSLIDCGVLSIDDNEQVRIAFLDEQKSEILKEEKKLSEAGRKGASARWGKNMRSHSDPNGNKEEDIEEEEEEDKDRNSKVSTKQKVSTSNKLSMSQLSDCDVAELSEYEKISLAFWNLTKQTLTQLGISTNEADRQKV